MCIVSGAASLDCPLPLNLGEPLSAVGVVDSVGSIGGRLLTTGRPRCLPRSSSTWLTGIVGWAENRPPEGGVPLNAGGVGEAPSLPNDWLNELEDCAPWGVWMAKPVRMALVSCCGGNRCGVCLNTVTPFGASVGAKPPLLPAAAVFCLPGKRTDWKPPLLPCCCCCVVEDAEAKFGCVGTCCCCGKPFTRPNGLKRLLNWLRPFRNGWKNVPANREKSWLDGD